MNSTEYRISAHAKQRYSERIMGKDNKADVNRFISEHEEKIQTDISKMLEYGEVIYSGKQKDKYNRNNTVDVYRNGCWILLVDKCTKNVITLYKIDLGCGDDFNMEYIDRMVENIKIATEAVSDVQDKISDANNVYREMIDDNNEQIAEYRQYIKNLESLNDGYKQIIDNNSVSINQAKSNLAEIVNTLIGRKEF